MAILSLCSYVGEGYPCHIYGYSLLLPEGAEVGLVEKQVAKSGATTYIVEIDPSLGFFFTSSTYYNDGNSGRESDWGCHGEKAPNLVPTRVHGDRVHQGESSYPLMDAKIVFKPEYPWASVFMGVNSLFPFQKNLSDWHGGEWGQEEFDRLFRPFWRQATGYPVSWIGDRLSVFKACSKVAIAEEVVNGWEVYRVEYSVFAERAIWRFARDPMADIFRWVCRDYASLSFASAKERHEPLKRVGLSHLQWQEAKKHLKDAHSYFISKADEMTSIEMIEALLATRSLRELSLYWKLPYKGEDLDRLGIKFSRSGLEWSAEWRLKDTRFISGNHSNERGWFEVANKLEILLLDQMEWIDAQTDATHFEWANLKSEGLALYAYKGKSWFAKLVA